MNRSSLCLAVMLLPLLAIADARNKGSEEPKGYFVEGAEEPDSSSQENIGNKIRWRLKFGTYVVTIDRTDQDGQEIRISSNGKDSQADELLRLGRRGHQTFGGIKGDILFVQQLGAVEVFDLLTGKLIRRYPMYSKDGKPSLTTITLVDENIFQFDKPVGSVKTLADCPNKEPELMKLELSCLSLYQRVSVNYLNGVEKNIGRKFCASDCMY